MAVAMLQTFYFGNWRSFLAWLKNNVAVDCKMRSLLRFSTSLAQKSFLRSISGEYDRFNSLKFRVHVQCVAKSWKIEEAALPKVHLSIIELSLTEGLTCTAQHLHTHISFHRKRILELSPPSILS